NCLATTPPDHSAASRSLLGAYAPPAAAPTRSTPRAGAQAAGQQRRGARALLAGRVDREPVEDVGDVAEGALDLAHELVVLGGRGDTGDDLRALNDEGGAQHHSADDGENLLDQFHCSFPS